MRKKIYLTLEFLVLFVGVPLFIFLGSDIVHPSKILLPVVLVVVIILARTSDFKARTLFRWGVPKAEFQKQMIVQAGILVLLLLGTVLFSSHTLFNLPKTNPYIWLLLSVFYPIFSAFAQEVIFRLFLFSRYKKLFDNDVILILVSGLVFSFAHIMYYHVVSIVLTFFAGVYLAQVYHQTKSVLWVALLHGIMGNMVFAVGLGQYFWLDMQKYL